MDVASISPASCVERLSVERNGSSDSKGMTDTIWRVRTNPGLPLAVNRCASVQLAAPTTDSIAKREKGRAIELKEAPNTKGMVQGVDRAISIAQSSIGRKLILKLAATAFFSDSSVLPAKREKTATDAES